MDGAFNGSLVAIMVGVWATFALDVYSTLNSSPQTTELFAADRADSLLHWVNIGSGVAIGGGVVATMVARRPWPLIATIIVAAGMHLCYRHAVKRGIGQPRPASAED